MSLHHSAATHQSLLSRIPQVTGRDLAHWYRCLDDGPGLVRAEERASWLCQEHGLPHGYALALVHEHDRRRAAARG